MIARLWSAFQRDWLEHQGSTRGAALMRIGFVVLLWRKLAASLVLSSVYADTPLLVLACVFWVASLAAFLGYRSRTAVLVTGIVGIFLYFDQGMFGPMRRIYDHHHLWLLLVCLTLLGFTDCGGSFSVDRWLAVRRAWSRGEEAPPEHGALWGLRLIALQLSAIYFYGAHDKVYLAFPDRMEHYMLDLYFGSDYPPFPGFRPLMVFSAVATIVIEYWLAVAFWVRRWRTAAVIVGVALHGMFFVVLRVSTFSATMLLCYLATLDPASIHRRVDEVMGIGRPSPRRPDQQSPASQS